MLRPRPQSNPVHPERVGRTRAVVLALLCLAGCQCQRPPLVSGDGELRADRMRVDFGETWLQSTGRRSVLLSNSGRAALTLTLETATPFGAPKALTLGGGESQQVELTFEPAALGPATALINVNAANAHLTLALDGVGIEPPPCDSTVCRTGRLDEATLRCIQSPLPDGEACGDRCVTGACSSGACVGALVDCDDQDPCTVDSCAPGEGCLHAPKICAAADPCSVGSCAPGVGCVQTNADDGVACGDSDCSTARVCVSGQCVTRTVPDGVPCGRESLCQVRGVCTAQQCVQPAPTALARAWTYKSPSQLHGLVADPKGNFFTAECRNTGNFNAQCQLVSFTPAGVERWRVAYPHGSYQGTGALRDSLMVANEVVISTIGPSWVDAFDVSTGAHKWSVDTSTSGIFGAVNPSFVRFNSTAFDGADELILSLESVNSGSIGATRVVGLVYTSGVVRHSLLQPAQGFSVVLDKSGGIYLGHLSGYPTLLDSVTALDSAWTVKWQRSTPVVDNRINNLQATHAGRLMISHPQLTQLWSTAGVPVASTLPNSFIGNAPVAWGDSALFYVQQFCPAGTSCQSYYDYSVAVVSVDNQSFAARVTPLPRQSWFSTPWLTQRGTVLVSLQPRVGPSELDEVDENGRVRMQCPLGLALSRSPASEPLLTDGQYAMLNSIEQSGGVVELNVWQLPGYSVAPTGWSSPRGGPGLTRRAR
jgi:hypothetical protein